MNVRTYAIEEINRKDLELKTQIVRSKNNQIYISKLIKDLVFLTSQVATKILIKIKF